MHAYLHSSDIGLTGFPVAASKALSSAPAVWGLGIYHYTTCFLFSVVINYEAALESGKWLGRGVRGVTDHNTPLDSGIDVERSSLRAWAAPRI